jgi:hypothetical protein
LLCAASLMLNLDKNCVAQISRWRQFEVEGQWGAEEASCKGEYT